MGSALALDLGDDVLDVVWGLGSGRRARALLREGRRVEILAIDVEPTRPDLARAVILGCERLRTACDDGRLRVVLGAPASFARRWHELGASNTTIATHVDLAALTAVPAAARDLAHTVARLHLERIDLHRFADRMRKNLVENLDAIAGAASLSAWTDAARRRPAFVLAAGPSARAAMPWLAQARSLGPVIAVDTALPLCREFEVPVDCLVSVDPHPASRVHLGQGGVDVHTLAFQPYCAPVIVDAFRRRVVALPSGDRLCDRAGPELALPSVPVAGTVLLYALQIAATLGCDPVIMVGADFAHVGGRTHALGTATARDAAASGRVVADTRAMPVPTTSALLGFLGEVERHVGRSNAERGEAKGEAPHGLCPGGGGTGPLPLTEKSRHWAVDGGGARVAGTRVVTQAAMERWVRQHPDRGKSPEPLPVPDIEDELGIARRRAIWLRLLGEVD